MSALDTLSSLAARTASQSELERAEGKAEFVLLGIPDVNGSIRGKALRPAAFEAALREGTVMTDLVLALDPTDTPITDYTRFGIRSGAGDLLVHPDPQTLHPLTWRPGWRVCLATPSWLDGRPCELATREVLRRVVNSLSQLGYDTLAALEYEVRVWDADGKPLSSGLSYSFGELGGFDAFIRALVPALEALGVELAAVHTEAGPGLLELNLGPRPALQAADDAALVKLAVKDLAASMGLRATFLAKTRAGEEGSSGHVHFSCWRDHRNAFHSADATTVPATFRCAVAGLLEHLPAASLLLNPTINSYKRLVPGWFAPVNVSWGIENRSTAVRAIVRPDHPELCRLECRRPGADASPYLALAAVVVGVADGIRRQLNPPPPLEGDAYARPELPELPGSLEAALRAFEADAAFRQALDERFSAYYVTSREWELKAWRGVVTDWERDRYARIV
jgi:glutamine synthetase